MSFELATSYTRPLLRPLVIPPTHSEQVSTTLRVGTPSQPWRSSTHIFNGTDDRSESAAWPPSKFGDDAAGIPSDEAYNIPYDAANSQAGNAEAFELFADQKKNLKASKVPPPRLVAKRYIPTDKANGCGQGVALLTLTGMGVPKEASCTVLNVASAAGN